MLKCPIPTLRYRDAQAALAFLCALGFERHAVVLDGCMVMLGSARPEAPDKPFGF